MALVRVPVASSIAALLGIVLAVQGDEDPSPPIPGLGYAGPYGNPLTMPCQPGERNMTLPGVAGRFCATRCTAPGRSSCPSVFNTTSGLPNTLTHHDGDPPVDHPVRGGQARPRT